MSNANSHLKEEAVDRTLWITCFGRGFEPVVINKTGNAHNT